MDEAVKRDAANEDFWARYRVETEGQLRPEQESPDDADTSEPE